MSISADGMSVPPVSPDSAIIRAQEAFAAARTAQARPAQSIQPAAAPAPQPATAPQPGAVIAQITQRAGATAAMLRQNEPNNPLVSLADGIHQTLAQSNGDPFAAFGRINDLQNALQFALSSSERLLENPALKPIR